MEAFKPLLPLGEGTVLEKVAASLRRGGIGEIYLVTGHERERMNTAARKHGLKEVHNPQFARGMFSSIQTGIGALPSGVAGCFLVPVDCPLFGSETIEKMRREMGEGRAFAVPTYRGKKGHPLYVPAKHFQEILNHDGKGGLKAITDAYFVETLRIPVEGEGVLMDMDTKEEYEKVKEFLAKGKVSRHLSPLASGRRFILVRHGQIRQHKEKIFLGQTDVPLSPLGQDQARSAADKVTSLGAETDRVYASDLSRAFETAKLLAAGRQLVPVAGFREMSLGDWDGRFIREIQTREPEAYRLRGEHMWTYKKGNRSENFYDLQYRVVKALIKILEKDNSRDVIIVAHKGVVRAIENNLNAGDVSDPWEAMGNGEVRVVEG